MVRVSRPIRSYAGATKVATVVRTFGHAETEVWGATEWSKFKELVRYLPPAMT